MTGLLPRALPGALATCHAGWGRLLHGMTRRWRVAVAEAGSGACALLPPLECFQLLALVCCPACLLACLPWCEGAVWMCWRVDALLCC